MKRFWPFLLLLLCAPIAIAGAAFRGIDKTSDGGLVLRFSTGDVGLPVLSRNVVNGLNLGNGTAVTSNTVPFLNLMLGNTATTGANYLRIGANSATSAISLSDIRSTGGLAIGSNAESKSVSSDLWGLINTAQGGAVLSSSASTAIFVGSNSSAVLGSTTAALQPSVNSALSAFPMLFSINGTTGRASFSNGPNTAKTLTTGLELTSTQIYSGTSDVIPAIYNNVASSDGVATTPRIQYGGQWNTSNVWGIGTDGSTAPSIVIGVYTPSTGKLSVPLISMLSGGANSPVGGPVTIGTPTLSIFSTHLTNGPLQQKVNASCSVSGGNCTTGSATDNVAMRKLRVGRLSSNADSMDVATIDISRSQAGVRCVVDVYSNGFDANISSYYKCYAFAESTGTVFTAISCDLVKNLIGTGSAPTVTWSGAGTSRNLRITNVGLGTINMTTDTLCMSMDGTTTGGNGGITLL